MKDYLTQKEAAADRVKTALYRHFDADGNLLYVGISLCAVTRLSNHRHVSAWYDKIYRVEIEWFDSRRAAHAAERKAIREESPKHNIQHTTPEKQKRKPQPIPQAEESKKELVRRLVTFSPLYSMQTAADELGVSPGMVKRWMDEGRLDYVMGGSELKPRKFITGWHLIDFLERAHIVGGI